MIELLSKKEPGLCKPLPDNWQEILGFVSDSCLHSEPAGYCRLPIIVCGECSSTFAVARALLNEKKLPVWGSVLTLGQWQGRGQKGREWISPPGNIYASLRLPAPPPKWDTILSLLCGYCLVQAFSELGFAAVLKWPNDILLCGSKVAGLLLEERAGEIVLGTGINVSFAPPASSLRSGTTIKPTCLNQQGQKTFFALPLWSTLVSSFYFCYQNMVLRLTPSVFLTRLYSNFAFSGEIVTITLKNEEVTGLFSGLTPDGGIVLTVGDKTRVFFSGSLLPAI